MTDVILGDNYIVQAVLTDIYDVPVTPDTQSVKLYDPNHVLKATVVAPALQSAGVYWATFAIPTAGAGGVAGIWEIVWQITKTGLVDSEKFWVKVIATP